MMSQREVCLTFIEELRRRKTVLKTHIADLENQVIQIDIQIRDIRQHTPLEQPIKPERKRLTKEEKLQKELERVTAELDALKRGITKK